MTVEESTASEVGTVPTSDTRWSLMWVLFTSPSPGSYLHWGVISVSYTNLAIVGLMVLVFVLALLLPFGRSGR